MKIGDKIYYNDGAYPLNPGQSWYYPIDGVKTQLHPNMVFKAPGGDILFIDLVIDKTGNVDLDFYGLGPYVGGWKSVLPAPNWTNLWTSVPYKP